MVANHISREAWYQIKFKIKDSWGFSETVLGGLDSTFLFFYAAGLYMAGDIEDRFSTRLVMPVGMAFSACWIFLMSVLGFLDAPIIGVYFVLWALNGLS